MIEHDRLEQFARGQEERHGQHGQRGQPLRVATAAEFTRHQAAEHDRARARQRAEAAQFARGERRHAEEGFDEVAQQGHERRLVHVAPGGTASAGEIVELVLMETVAAADERVYHQLHGGERQQDAPGGGEEGG